MAFKKNRTESLPDDQGLTFKVGDGANYGFNGDRHPLTVVFVSDSGREILLSHDTFKPNGPSGYTEGDQEGVFTTSVDEHTASYIKFKLRAGVFRNHGGSYRLNPGRKYARNPHI